MLDSPRADDIVEAVARLLRETLMPKLPAEAVFHARVAANALELAVRELRHGKRVEQEAELRLQRLLGAEGSLVELESELSSRIRDGRIDLQTPELERHLWATTLAKVSIDQPNYASYRRELEERSTGNRGEPE
jgi:hypothetical protein